jgi:hypothetical protein
LRRKIPGAAEKIRGFIAPADSDAMERGFLPAEKEVFLQSETAHCAANPDRCIFQK